MNISVLNLLKIPNANIIDIRSRENFNNRHIPNAKNIEAKELMIRPDKYLNKNETYYLYCRHGITSQKVCQILTSRGYKTINVIGGYEAWLLQN